MKAKNIKTIISFEGKIIENNNAIKGGKKNHPTWECEDTCTAQSESVFCGTTDHL